ncbi:mitochondrial dicarboxylate carrier [Tribolium castaneum]|nr:PREDICTED: mitochondrial dicarboxylate carrier [Tribolium castaneum]|eukprot:XP_972977.1 PREDICTED: mitochondrial dicarboxylate carrier [Tribolium castaneum]
MSTSDRVPRWYFGGLASAMATFFTHPLDLIKVHLQTHAGKKISIIHLTTDIVKKNGFLSLYNGLSASLCRQLTYSVIRFGIYDTAKLYMEKDSSLTSRIFVAFFAGSFGGFVGTPPDKVNVRMQNDVKLPPEKRFNYKHAFDGLWHVYQSEGFAKLFTGGGTASFRAGVMGVGQLTSYDQIKRVLLRTSYFEDDLVTHFTSSMGAAVIATTITQPLDVIKTRVMNAKPGEFRNILDVVLFTAKEGPLGFFKGYVPAFLRIGPHTIITFIFYERLRMYFGYIPEPKVK